MKFFNLQDSVNSLTLIAAIALIVVTAYVVSIYMKQMRVKKQEGELSDENWDGIGEYKNDLPVGWAICFVAMIAWAVWYFLVGYPLNSFSQVGQYNDEVKAYNAKFDAKFKNITKSDLQAMGEALFLVECAPCHGINAKGIGGKAQDLTRWGTEEGILYTIAHGSKGMGYPKGMAESDWQEMTPELATGDEAKAVAAYMSKEVSAIKSTKNPQLIEQGREAWGLCTSCHGEDGKGMDGFAPDLTIYGSPDFVIEVLNNGKSGHIGLMPSFADGRITDIQKRALAEYLLSLTK